MYNVHTFPTIIDTFHSLKEKVLIKDARHVGSHPGPSDGRPVEREEGVDLGGGLGQLTVLDGEGERADLLHTRLLVGPSIAVRAHAMAEQTQPLLGEGGEGRGERGGGRGEAGGDVLVIAERMDYRKYHRKGHLKRSRMAQISAP